MSQSTASSIFPPRASYTPPSYPHDSGGLDSHPLPYPGTIGHAEAQGFAYSSSTSDFLPEQVQHHTQLPLSNPMYASHFAYSEDVSMSDTAPTYYNPPFIPPAQSMVWSSSHLNGETAAGSSERQQQLALSMAFPPRRPTLVPDDIMTTGPLPQAGYSFGTGGKRTSSASAPADPGVPSGGASCNTGASRVQHTGAGSQTGTVVDNHPDGEDKASPGAISNKTTSMQTTPKQLTPGNDRPASPLFLSSTTALRPTTLNASGGTAAASDNNTGTVLSRDGTIQHPQAEPLVANAGSSMPSSLPVHVSPAPLANVMPHPFAPLLPFSLSSSSLSHGPPSVSSSHSTSGQYPPPSPALDHPSPSSRFGSIDSGRISVFSGFSSGVEAESISSVPASYGDSCGNLLEDTGVGGVFERDVQGLPSDHGLRMSLATSPLTRLRQARLPTMGTATAIPSLSPTSTAGCSAATSTMLPAPLSYSLDRRASCPALPTSLPRPLTGLALPTHDEGASASPAHPETSAGVVGVSGPSGESRERPPVPKTMWDRPSIAAARRAAMPSSTSLPFTVWGGASTGHSTPSLSSGGSAGVVFQASARAESNRGLTRVASVPVLGHGNLSAAPSLTSRSFIPLTANSSSSSSSPSTLSSGPAFARVPQWERLSPPSPMSLFHATAASPAFTPAPASDTKDTSPRPDEAYPEALGPIGESPSTSGDSVSTPLTSTPFTTIGWSYDHPTIFVCSV